jgi:hypothetical protein
MHVIHIFLKDTQNNNLDLAIRFIQYITKVTENKVILLINYIM